MIVYRIENRHTGLAYIGITKHGVTSRFTQHCSQANTGSKAPLHAAIRHHGADAFEIKELCSCKTREDACYIERLLIADQKTLYPCGYNATIGGERGSSWYPGATKKQSVSLRQYFHENPASRDLISKAQAARWKKPEYRTRMIAAFATASRDPQAYRNAQAKGAATKHAKRDAAVLAGTASDAQRQAYNKEHGLTPSKSEVAKAASLARWAQHREAA